jgi:hypothetical protein
LNKGFKEGVRSFFFFFFFFFNFESVWKRGGTVEGRNKEPIREGGEGVSGLSKQKAEIAGSCTRAPQEAERAD